MRRPMRFILLKELAEVYSLGYSALLLFAVAFFAEVKFAGPIGSDPDPARPITWFSILAIAGAVIGYRQTSREGRGDMWTFALHRPARGGMLFGAKFIVGAGVLLIAYGIPWALAMWWLSVPGHRPIPFDRAFWLPGIADFFAGVTVYAAGLYAGSRRRMTATRAIGFVIALMVWLVTSGVNSFAVAIAVSTTFTAILALAAWADFVSGSDFESQPLWGRAASAFSGITALAIVAAIPRATVVTSQGAYAYDVPDTVRVFPARTVLNILAVWPDKDLIRVMDLRTDPRLVPSMTAARYREPRRWTTRLFAALPGPIWFFERRVGLIGIYDENTGARRGWLGPEGYSEGPALPAKRFAGEMQIERLEGNSRRGLLVLSGGVYMLNELAPPTMVFAAPAGETILAAKEAYPTEAVNPLRPDQQWGWFTGVTTNKATYVVGTGTEPQAVTKAEVQIRLEHASDDANRNVSIYRASNTDKSPTFIWYVPRHESPGDTVSHMVHYQVGFSLPMMEYRFGARPYPSPTQDRPEPSLDTRTVIAPLDFMPALQVWSLASRMTTEERAKANLRGAAWLVAGAVAAAFAFWICLRYGFSRRRALSWAIASAIAGPITLIAMWLLLEWPARESRSGQLRIAAS